jgi:prepilin-type N-terminal cleavage/methylation domain-containing protein
MCVFKKAFTLAEVLITLLIIGVIASIVIPGLINDTNDSEYNAALKKAYSDLSQAVMMVQVNNGGEINFSSPNPTALRDDFCNVMSCVTKAGLYEIFGPTDYKYYKGGSAGWPNSVDYTPGAILNNGNFVRILPGNPNCNSFGVNGCSMIHIDINGKKGPNMAGKDLYLFYLVRKNGAGAYSILPAGSQGDTSFPDCISGSTGFQNSMGCTARRLTDSGNMP